MRQFNDTNSDAIISEAKFFFPRFFAAFLKSGLNFEHFEKNDEPHSSKKKNFSQFFAEFLKSRLNFEHFEKKDDPHSFCISEVTYLENVVR